MSGLKAGGWLLAGLLGFSAAVALNWVVAVWFALLIWGADIAGGAYVGVVG